MRQTTIADPTAPRVRNPALRTFRPTASEHLWVTSTGRHREARSGAGSNDTNQPTPSHNGRTGTTAAHPIAPPVAGYQDSTPHTPAATPCHRNTVDRGFLRLKQ